MWPSPEEAVRGALAAIMREGQVLMAVIFRADSFFLTENKLAPLHNPYLILAKGSAAPPTVLTICYALPDTYCR
jgi:hypothetical protein